MRIDISTLSGVVFILVLALQVSALSVDDTELDLDIYKGVEKSFSVNLTNEENKTIYDVQMEDINHFEFSTIKNMTYNQSLSYSFDVYTNKTLDTTLSTKLIWFYKEILETDIQTYYVNITGDGFEPNSLDFDQNDHIILKNKEDTEIEVEEWNNKFDSFTIPAFGEHNFSEEDIGFYEMFYNGNFLDLNVTNKTKLQKVHYSEDDIPMKFNVNAEYPSSNLKVDLYTQTFNVDYNGYVDGVVQLTAQDDDVFNVDLEMDWVDFDELDGFNLAQGQSKIITFRIEPEINKTSQTNKTHSKELVVKSSNTPTHTKSVNIKIPYQYLGTDDEESSTRIIKIFDEDACYDYCEEYPDKCPLETKTRTVYQVKEQNVSLSQKQINGIINENQRLRNELDSQTGKINDLRSTVIDFQQSLGKDVDYLKDREDAQVKKQQDRNISVALVLFIVAGLVGLILLVIFTPKLFRSYKTKKMLKNGVY